MRETYKNLGCANEKSTPIILLECLNKDHVRNEEINLDTHVQKITCDICKYFYYIDTSD